MTSPFKVLCEAGIQFMGPMPEPPHRRPRLHAIVPHSKGYIHHLSKALRRNGGNVLTNARAVGLMRTGNRVAGVEIERSGHKSVIHARKGVIIASGDFSSASRNYKQRFMADSLLSLSGINPASTGDGQRLGEEVGGEVVNGDLAWGPELRFLAPPKPAMISRLPPYRIVGGAVLAAMRILPNWLLRPMLMSFVTTFLAPSHNLFREGAALVNMKGKRFCDENARPQDHVSGQPEQLCYTVFDQTVADKFQAWPNFISTAPGVGYAYLGDYERSRRDIFFKADSWQELGRKMGMDGEVLSETIRDRNAGLNARTASEPPLPPLVKPPFYGLGPAKPWIVFSEGGLRVDETMRVLTPSNEAVPGLFAAGSAGQGGVILEGHGHHLGWAFTSGRIAGRSASASTTITTET